MWKPLLLRIYTTAAIEDKELLSTSVQVYVRAVDWEPLADVWCSDKRYRAEHFGIVFHPLRHLRLSDWRPPVSLSFSLPVNAHIFNPTRVSCCVSSSSFIQILVWDSHSLGLNILGVSAGEAKKKKIEPPSSPSTGSERWYSTLWSM